MPAKIVEKDLRPAPGDLRIVQAFLNTVNHESGVDELVGPGALAAWLADQGLGESEAWLDDADVARAVEVREAWREWIRGAPAAKPELCERLDRLLGPVTVRPRHAADGTLRLPPASSAGLDGALGRMATVITEAQLDGSWQRVKVCASAACRALFYDFSNNRTGRWCNPRCGNRMSARLSRRHYRRLRSSRYG